MDDMNMDLGLDEFGIEENDLAAFGVDESQDEVELATDLEGFASGFPKWDLHPPKK